MNIKLFLYFLCGDIKCFFGQLWLYSIFYPSLFWKKLWIRKDEFHSSLDLDDEALYHMNKEQQKQYLENLANRRWIAHLRDMKKEDKKYNEKHKGE